MICDFINEPGRQKINAVFTKHNLTIFISLARAAPKKVVSKKAAPAKKAAPKKVAKKAAPAKKAGAKKAAPAKKAAAKKGKKWTDANSLTSWIVPLIFIISMFAC